MVRDTIMTLIFPDGDASQAQEATVDTLIELQSIKLKNYLPTEYKEIPHDLEYIVVETTIARFNRIGSEGMRSESVEGHDMTFDSADVADYAEEIARWITAQDENGLDPVGMVRFL